MTASDHRPNLTSRLPEADGFLIEIDAIVDQRAVDFGRAQFAPDGSQVKIT